jgi:hypothetical protein
MSRRNYRVLSYKENQNYNTIIECLRLIKEV